jgi:RNA polymerase sigma factor (sigma-70 family)
MRTQPDGRLVALVREGYELAFEEIVRRYRRPLGRFAASIVGSHSEDVTQDAFSKALLALRRDDREIELRPWLFRIVRNTALNELRDRPAAAEALAEDLAGGAGTAELAEQREQLADLIARLRALPEAQRAAIVMRELEGLGHDEIAAALGLSGGAARQAIHRARRALRDGMGLLVPLPLLRAALAGSGTNAAEAAAGVGGAAGAGVALKATAASVLVAGAVGAGVAIEHVNPRTTVGALPAIADQRPGDSRSEAGASGGATPSAIATAGDSGSDRGADRDDRDHSGEGSRSSGPGGGGGDHASGRGRGPSGDRNGASGTPTTDDGPGSAIAPAPSSSNSGPGSGDDGGSSGSGSSGSGSSGSGSSGSGSGSSGSGTSGSGSSGSGSSGSGSSGPGTSGSGTSGSGESGSSSSGPGSGSVTDEELAEPSIDNSGPGSLDSSGDPELDGGLSH